MLLLPPPGAGRATTGTGYSPNRSWSVMHHCKNFWIAICSSGADAILQEMKLFDLPKLLDICAIIWTSTEVGTSAGYIPADGSMTLASSSHSYGRFTRKSMVDLPESEILNSRDDIEMTRAVALASQYEYEDGYDDSYDDLGMSLVERMRKVRT